MNDGEVLSAEEKDALINGVKSGSVNVGDTERPRGEIHVVDFSSQERIVRGEMPVLERIHERLTKSLTASIYNIMGRDVDIQMDEIKTLKYKDFIYTVNIPTSINICRFHPLRGKSLFLFDSKLVYSLVDHYFGGKGQDDAEVKEREFTNTEIRIKDILLNKAVIDFEQAWERTLPLKVERLGTETNPQMLNIYSQEELIIVTSYTITFNEKSHGKMMILTPYTMLEPIRDLLDIGAARSDDDVDPNWVRSIREQILEVPLELSSILASTTLSLGKVSSLKPGDIIPIEIPESVTLEIEGIPSYITKYGKSKDKCALKIIDMI